MKFENSDTRINPFAYDGIDDFLQRAEEARKNHQPEKEVVVIPNEIIETKIKRVYTHYKKEIDKEGVIKERFNSPDAEWRRAIKSLPLMGCSIDITFKMDRASYDFQLSFTSDLSQKEKMQLLTLIKLWASDYMDKIIPVDEEILSSTHGI